ncbi:MAG: carboxypeptidase-like regulatory domain-containing protein [Gemmata sp.]
MRAGRFLVLAIAAAWGALLAPARAGAHDMNATVTVGASGIRAEVFFEEDLPAGCAAVSVTDAAGAEAAAGTTDERGVWAGPALPPGEYLLTAKSAGHVAKVRFAVSGAPDAPPVSHTGARLDKTVGLTADAGGLLGASAAVWFRRRRRE